VSEAQIEELLPDTGPSDAFAIWPENLDTLEAFLALSTQWRTDGMTGIVLGLDYPAIEATLRMLGVRDRRRTFLELRAMERAALETLNKDA
jgi:hypothetical protein